MVEQTEDFVNYIMPSWIIIFITSQGWIGENSQSRRVKHIKHIVRTIPEQAMSMFYFPLLIKHIEDNINNCYTIHSSCAPS